jgi:hypothetical protein
LKYAISHKAEWNSEPAKVWKDIQTHSIFWCKQFQVPIRPFSGNLIISNKVAPIPWNQVAALHTSQEGAAQP